jgi:hypothetical protein
LDYVVKNIQVRVEGYALDIHARNSVEGWEEISQESIGSARSDYTNRRILQRDKDI